MRSVSTWILVVALAIAGYYAWEERRADTRAAEAASLPGAEASPEQPQPVADARSAGRSPAIAAPAPAPSPFAPPIGAAPAAIGSDAGAVLGYRGKAEAARVAGDRLYAAAFGQGWLHAAAPGGEEAIAADAFLVDLERVAVEAANEAARASNASAQRAELSVAYMAAADAGRRGRYRDILADLAAAEVLSRKGSADAVAHAVAPGDSLAKIAGRYGFPVEGLQRVNGLGASTAIRVGQTIKVPQGPIEVIAVKGEFRLALFANQRFIREYGIGIGKDDSTPEATFAIGEKQVNPTWYSPKGVFAPGTEGNILGTRWLGFVDTDEHRGFGIHGTTFPDSIGRAESSGCLRLKNADVEDLFSFVPRGARVTIVR